ncbi:class I tRNA ligase family protein [Longispora urticae]
MSTDRLTVIIGPSATPNGGLHVGHMAGPYLGADVYARYRRARGHRVMFTTGTDDSQTYVDTTARRRGITTGQLLVEAAADIQASLDALAISVDAFVPSDGVYRTHVLSFVTALHGAGRLRLRTVRLPYSEARGEFLVDGHVAGDCAVCLADTCGGVCESCGHHVDYERLHNLRSTEDPADPVTLREATILVLPMEEYRAELESYHANRPFRWRPHIEQIIGELLARPLQDMAVTYPISRGIPAPFPEVAGQVVNPWVEAMPASIHGTWWGMARTGERSEAPDEQWRAEHDAQLVYFVGYDNAPNWSLTYLALLMAHGDRYIRPEAIVCNEFYELDHEKFSTSRGHLVRSVDLAAEVPRDLVRFFLALTGPETQRTNFSRPAVDDVAHRRLVEPWNALADAVAKATVGLEPGATLPVTPVGRERAAALVERFELCYELPTFSLTRAAEGIGAQAARLAELAEARLGAELEALGDLLLEVRTLLACAAPLLVDATGSPDWPSSDMTEISVFTMVKLPSTVELSLP